MPLSFFLYTSRLATGINSSSVGTIIKQARALNAATGITGVLGFDGENFVQYVEGPPIAVHKLLASITSDKRHSELNIKAQGENISIRKFPDWQMGYAYFEDFPFDIARLEDLEASAALQYFLENARSMDFD